MQDTPDNLMQFKRWRFGAVTVTRVLEMAPVTLDPAWLLKITQENVRKHSWLLPDFATAEGLLKVNVQAFVIEAAGKRIMVDPCIGNHKKRAGALFNMLDNPFLERLEAAGFPRESIDFVLCTHLHTDHCGWNTMLVNGRWVPTFPKARYFFARDEFEFARTDKGDEQEATYEDSVKPIVDAGLAELIDYNHAIVEGVRLEHSPGHTPGHCFVVVSSGGEEAVITGDMMHHPVQAAEPDVCSNYCWDEQKAIATRKALLDRAVKEETTVLGTHFAEPTAVKVVRSGTAWRMTGA